MKAIKHSAILLTLATVLQGCEKAPDAAAANAENAANPVATVASGAASVPAEMPMATRTVMVASAPVVVGEGGNATAVVSEIKGGLQVGGKGPVVAFYPGAREDAAKGNKEPIPGGNMITVLLTTRDPIEKVAAFYRAQLKANWPAQSINEQANDDTAVIMSASSLEGDKTVMINVARSEDDGKGSTISILTATKVMDAKP